MPADGRSIPAIGGTRNEKCLKRNRPQIGTVNPQQSDVSGGVASDDLGRHRVAAGKCDGELAVLGQGFIGCDALAARRSRSNASGETEQR